jgi:hypothetical protein
MDSHAGIDPLVRVRLKAQLHLGVEQLLQRG